MSRDTPHSGGWPVGRDRQDRRQREAFEDYDEDEFQGGSRQTVPPSFGSYEQPRQHDDVDDLTLEGLSISAHGSSDRGGYQDNSNYVHVPAPAQYGNDASGMSGSHPHRRRRRDRDEYSEELYAQQESYDAYDTAVPGHAPNYYTQPTHEPSHRSSKKGSSKKRPSAAPRDDDGYRGESRDTKQNSDHKSSKSSQPGLGGVPSRSAKASSSKGKEKVIPQEYEEEAEEESPVYGPGLDPGQFDQVEEGDPEFQDQFAGQYVGQYAGQYAGQYVGQYEGQYEGRYEEDSHGQHKRRKDSKSAGRDKYLSKGKAAGTEAGAVVGAVARTGDVADYDQQEAAMQNWTRYYDPTNPPREPTQHIELLSFKNKWASIVALIDSGNSTSHMLALSKYMELDYPLDKIDDTTIREITTLTGNGYTEGSVTLWYRPYGPKQGEKELMFEIFNDKTNNRVGYSIIFQGSQKKSGQRGNVLMTIGSKYDTTKEERRRMRQNREAQQKDYERQKKKKEKKEAEKSSSKLTSAGAHSNEYYSLQPSSSTTSYSQPSLNNQPVTTMTTQPDYRSHGSYSTQGTFVPQDQQYQVEPYPPESYEDQTRYVGGRESTHSRDQYGRDDPYNNPYPNDAYAGEDLYPGQWPGPGPGHGHGHGHGHGQGSYAAQQDQYDDQPSSSSRSRHHKKK